MRASTKKVGDTSLSLQRTSSFCLPIFARVRPLCVKLKKIRPSNLYDKTEGPLSRGVNREHGSETDSPQHQSRAAYHLSVQGGGLFVLSNTGEDHWIQLYQPLVGLPSAPPNTRGGSSSLPLYRVLFISRPGRVPLSCALICVFFVYNLR